MTIDQNTHPLAYAAFERWFEMEGWGADSVDDLSQHGLDEWLPDFLRDFEADTVEEVELALQDSE